MWWKLTVLATVTIVAIVCVIPSRSRAVKYDVIPGQETRTPLRLPLRQMLGNMYLTRGTLVLIAIILAIAAAIALDLVRAG